MVKEIKHKGKTYFQCEACEMYYEDRKIAQKCEDFCSKHKSCNTELIKHAVQLDTKKENCC
jgi:hypothetical protein